MLGEKEINVAEFKRYLLGNLAPAEMEAIDLQIISDEDSEEKLLWAESELMEDYLEKTLSSPEIELFEKNFLVSPARRTELKNLAALKNYARQAETKNEKETESFAEKIKNFFALNLRPATAVFALAIVCACAAFFYLTASKQTTAEKEFAEINQRDLSDLSAIKNIFAVNLASGNFRGANGATTKLPVDKLSGKVLFRLALPGAATASDTFQAELVRDQKVVFTQTDLRFYNNPNGQELRLLLPAAPLEKGEYQIKVVNENRKDSIFTYNFAVE